MIYNIISGNNLIILNSLHVSHGRSPGDVSEESVTQEKEKKVWRISCDVGEAMEGLENEL